MDYFKLRKIKPIHGYLMGFRQFSFYLEFTKSNPRNGKSPVEKLQQSIKSFAKNDYIEINKDFMADAASNISIHAYCDLLIAIEKMCGGLTAQRPKRVAQSKYIPKEKENIIKIIIPTINTTLFKKIIIWVQNQIHKIEIDQINVPSKTEFKSLINSLSLLAPEGKENIKLIKTAVMNDIPYTFIGRNIILFGAGKSGRLFQSTSSELTSHIGMQLSSSKILSHDILSDAGFPVAEQKIVSNFKQLIDYSKEIGFPVVLKPYNGARGIGVYSNIKNNTQLLLAYKKLLKISETIILEKHIYGNNYRVNVFNNEAPRAILYTYPYITGDGISNVQALISNQISEKLYCLKNELTTQVLESQGLNLLSIPPKDEIVDLVFCGNASQGGNGIDVSQIIHPDNKKLCIDATRLLRLDISGVDLIMPDISQSWKKHGGVICEINSRPQTSEKGPDFLSFILKKYCRKQCIIVIHIGANISSTNRQEILKKILDPLVEEIYIDLNIMDLFKNGLPVPSVDSIYIYKKNLSDSTLSLVSEYVVGHTKLLKVKSDH